MKSVEIIVATHKKYEMPKGKYYLPLHVGAKNSNNLSYKKDSTGDNISEKNPRFCELTGLYWAWKNSNKDYIGLVHYRRHFTLTPTAYIRKKNRIKYVLSTKEIDYLINNPDTNKDFDLILPKKRSYVIESVYSHYAHTHDEKPLKRTRSIIKRVSPEYLPEFDKLKERKSAHMFNMMIGDKKIIDAYCKWLFKVLFELEKELEKDEDIQKKYNTFQKRFYGRISELLFDVWLYTNYPELKDNLTSKRIRIKEVRVLELDGSKILRRSFSLIRSKFTGRKYHESF